MNTRAWRRRLEPEGFENIDLHFAELLARMDKDAGEWVLVAAALTSRATRQGHVCLVLADAAGTNPTAGRAQTAAARYPDLAQWRRDLKRSRLVGNPGDYAPLILDSHDRLYLQRYWHYQNQLVNWLKERAGRPWRSADEAPFESVLDRLFPAADDGIDWQKMAAVVAWMRNFCIVSGGPGTGKTSTVARILALFLECSPAALNIKLVAPTGKAAARLQEAIREAKAGLNISPQIAAAIPDETSTIHRLLGAGTGASGFRQDAQNPLVADLVIVDEASMVDLALMCKLVRALPPRAGLVLLGDKDQLASVEAGAVLGDLCAAPDPARFSRSFVDALPKTIGRPLGPGSDHSRESTLLDCLVELKKNYRFADGTGIGALSDAIKQGKGRRALDLMTNSPDGSIAWRDLPPAAGLIERLVDVLGERLQSYLDADDVAGLFRAFNRFRVLCALRRGPFGVETLNTGLERWIGRHSNLRNTGIWYPRRPILITRNDHHLRLYNGDIGIAFGDAGGAGRIRVYFENPDGSFRNFHPLRLPDHETVFAMTVHKSQGSEFDWVHLVLPDRQSPVLTRELVYTGVTRGRRQVTVWGDREVFQAGVAARIERSSGLRDAFWGVPMHPPSG